MHSRPCSPACFLRATGSPARHGIALLLTGDGQHLLQAALQRTARFNHKQLRRLVELVTGTKPPAKIKVAGLQKTLIEAVFKDPTEEAVVKEAYARPSVTAEAALDARVDDNMAEVADIMQEEDPENCAEFKDVRDAVRRRRARNAAQAVSAAAASTHQRKGRGRTKAAPTEAVAAAPPALATEDEGGDDSGDEGNEASPAEPAVDAEVLTAAAEGEGGGDSEDEVGEAPPADLVDEAEADGHPVATAAVERETLREPAAGAAHGGDALPDPGGMGGAWLAEDAAHGYDSSCGDLHTAGVQSEVREPPIPSGSEPAGMPGHPATADTAVAALHLGSQGSWQVEPAGAEAAPQVHSEVREPPLPSGSELAGMPGHRAAADTVAAPHLGPQDGGQVEPAGAEAAPQVPMPSGPDDASTQAAAPPPAGGQRGPRARGRRCRSDNAWSVLWQRPRRRAARRPSSGGCGSTAPLCARRRPEACSGLPRPAGVGVPLSSP